MKIMDGNLLIAKFVGVEVTNLKDAFDDVTYKLPTEIVEFMRCSHFGYLRFYDSWDWLMVVVEKIEKLRPINNSSKQFRVNISGSLCIILDTFIDGNDTQRDFLNLYFDRHENKRVTVWNACVKFIKWYNINKGLYE